MLINDELRSQILSILSLEHPNKEDLAAAIQEFEDMFKVDKAKEQLKKQNKTLRYIDDEVNDYGRKGGHDFDNYGGKYGLKSRFDRGGFGSSYRGTGYDDSDQNSRVSSLKNVVKQPSVQTVGNPFTTGSGGSLASGSSGSGSSGSATAKSKIRYNTKPFNPPRPAAPPASAPASKEVKAEVEASGNNMKRYKTDPDVEIIEKGSSTSKPANLRSFQQGANEWKDSLKILLPDSGDFGDVKPTKKPRRK